MSSQLQENNQQKENHMSTDFLLNNKLQMSKLQTKIKTVKQTLSSQFEQESQRNQHLLKVANQRIDSELSTINNIIHDRFEQMIVPFQTELKILKNKIKNYMDVPDLGKDFELRLNSSLLYNESDKRPKMASLDSSLLRQKQLSHRQRDGQDISAPTNLSINRGFKHNEYN